MWHLKAIDMNAEMPCYFYIVLFYGSFHTDISFVKLKTLHATHCLPQLSTTPAKYVAKEGTI